MSGLESMMERMEAEANAQAAEIAAKAQADAAALLAEADAARAKKSAGIAEQARRDAAACAARIASAAEQQRRTALLAAKQEIIADVLEKSRRALQEKPAAEYFPYLLKVLERYAQPQRGLFCLSAADLARMPADFPAEVARVAASRGGSLTVSDQPRETGGGFLLIYGGIEENCTFSALFDARKEALQDQVHQMLFA